MVHWYSQKRLTYYKTLIWPKSTVETSPKQKGISFIVSICFAKKKKML